MDWQEEAKRVLKVELAKKRVSYKELVKALEEIGVEETERSITTKIYRGTFSLAFFLQCMHALKVKTIDVSGEPVSSDNKLNQE